MSLHLPQQVAFPTERRIHAARSEAAYRSISIAKIDGTTALVAEALDTRGELLRRRLNLLISWFNMKRNSSRREWYHSCVGLSRISFRNKCNYRYMKQKGQPDAASHRDEHRYLVPWCWHFYKTTLLCILIIILYHTHRWTSTSLIGRYQVPGTVDWLTYSIMKSYRY